MSVIIIIKLLLYVSSDGREEASKAIVSDGAVHIVQRVADACCITSEAAPRGNSVKSF